jgi:hypothetical protein
VRLVILLITSLTLSSCISSPIKFKDATHRTETHIVTDTPIADTVVVDLRNKVKDTVTEEYVVKNNRVEVANTEDKSPNTERRLFWFFFLMMFLGLFGAGIMGGVDVFANRKRKEDVPVQSKIKKSR